MNKTRVLYNKVFHRKQIQAVIKRVEANEEGLRILAEHPEFKNTSAILGRFFLEMKASNFVEVSMFDNETLSEYVLTIRKKGRPDDAEIREQMRDLLTNIAKGKYLFNEVMARDLLIKLGYWEKK